MDHLNGLREELDRFHGAVGDLDARVPSCPQWRVRDLVHHVGTVHRMFRRVAEEGWMRRPPALPDDDRPEPDDDRVVGWAREQGERLVVALEALDPAAPRWNFSRGPQVGAFIPRRMHHETAVHRWDVEGAYGVAGPIAADVATDGVAEYLEVYVPRNGVWPGRSATVHVLVEGYASLALHLPAGDLPVVGDVGDGPPDATVAGSPQQMLLALWDRRPLGDVFAGGDRELLDELRAFAYT